MKLSCISFSRFWQNVHLIVEFCNIKMLILACLLPIFIYIINKSHQKKSAMVVSRNNKWNIDYHFHETFDCVINNPTISTVKYHKNSQKSQKVDKFPQKVS